MYGRHAWHATCKYGRGDQCTNSRMPHCRMWFITDRALHSFHPHALWGASKAVEKQIEKLSSTCIQKLIRGYSRDSEGMEDFRPYCRLLQKISSNLKLD